MGLERQRCNCRSYPDFVHVRGAGINMPQEVRSLRWIFRKNRNDLGVRINRGDEAGNSGY